MTKRRGKSKIEEQDFFCFVDEGKKRGVHKEGKMKRECKMGEEK